MPFYKAILKSSSLKKTLYHYIEDDVFQNASVPITCMDLKRQVRRKIVEKKLFNILQEKIDLT